MTYKPSSGGSWLFGLFLSAIPCAIIFSVAIPPKFQKDLPQPRVTLAASWFGAAFSIVVVEFLIFGGAYLLLGSQGELLEHLQMLSMPLGWINPNFLITPAKSFLDVCGTVLGNSIFFGTIVFVCYQPVRAAFRRSKTTQLSLSGANPAEDDE